MCVGGDAPEPDAEVTMGVVVVGAVGGGAVEVEVGWVVCSPELLGGVEE